MYYIFSLLCNGSLWHYFALLLFSFFLEVSFLSPVQVISSAISPISLLKYPYSFFLPISIFWLLSSYCFTVCFFRLLLLSVAVVISVSLLFIISPALLYGCLHAIVNTDQSSSSFSYSLSSLEYKALSTIISSLSLWYICLISFFVHFQNDPGYHTRGNAQLFIPLIRFQLQSLVSTSFLVLLRYTFLTFSKISTCLMMFAFNILEYLWFSFSPSILMFFFFFFCFFFSVLFSFLFLFSHFSLSVFLFFKSEFPGLFLFLFFVFHFWQNS